jgi:hypothetical protein
VPGATVTVLFADVEGSTAMLERLGQTRWLAALAEYEELLSARIAEHGGTLIKAIGDGHLASFPSARAALRCAVEVQRALPLESAPDLRVRMGMHTGEPAVREDDLHGRTVVKAARIADLAHGGEVLVSAIVRELAQAAVALGDRDLCAQLLDDLVPLAGSCGVNGAVVAFAGSHAHTAGLLAAALDQPDRSRQLLEQASDTYQRLGAIGWQAETRRDLAAAHTAAEAPATSSSMHRRGGVWNITFAGAAAVVPHAKGLADIARLLAMPGTDVHVLDLMEAADRSGAAGPLADRRSLDAYRQRLADLESERDEAAGYHDDERAARLEAERQALLQELGRLKGAHGRVRQFANHPAERARKAVAARVRDAIGKLEAPLPELAAHLHRTIVTGTYCRYRGEPGLTWNIDASPHGPRTIPIL